MEYSDEFGDWWVSLSADVQEAVHVSVTKLSLRRPNLGFPDSSQIKGSKHGEMRELRVQCRGEHWRVLYAFDARRSAYLIIGGCKAGNPRFYEELVPKADRIHVLHRQEIAKSEG